MISKKRGKAVSEGAWTVVRVGALRKPAGGKFSASGRGGYAAEGSVRRESGRGDLTALERGNMKPDGRQRGALPRISRVKR